jgi:hypothetical protein
MRFLDPETAKKVATAAFRCDKVYSRRQVLARCGTLIRNRKGDSEMGIVKAHADGFCDVAFEFTVLKGGSRLKCFGMGRPEFVKAWYPQEGKP